MGVSADNDRGHENDSEDDGQGDEDYVAFEEEEEEEEDAGGGGGGGGEDDDDTGGGNEGALQFVDWKPEIELPTLPSSEEIFREKARSVSHVQLWRPSRVGMLLMLLELDTPLQ